MDELQPPPEFPPAPNDPLFREKNDVPVAEPNSESKQDQPQISPLSITEAQISVTDAQEAIISYPYAMGEILSMRAGPGSGKTFTLIARIAQMLQDGVEPDEILVLSMANRSVDALRQSLRRLVGAQKEQLVAVSTFHSFCGSLLDSRRPPDEPRPRVANSRTMLMFADFFLKKLVRMGGEKIDGFVNARRMAEFLPLLISQRVSVEEIARRYKINAAYLLQVVDYLQRYGLTVYDDIIDDAIRLLDSTAGAFDEAINLSEPELVDLAYLCLVPEVAKYKVVIVDEFQDIHPILLDAIRSIVNYPTNDMYGQLKHLTVSGDPRQCIYEFLGSSSSYVADLKQAFPQMHVVEKLLNESFRCTQPILDAAVGVVESPDCAGDRKEFTLQSLRLTCQAVQPIVYSCNDFEAESKLVVDEIVRLLCLLGGEIQPRDIAVLGVTNKQVEDFQQVLGDRAGIYSHKVRSVSEWPNTELGVFRVIAGVISGHSHASFDLIAILQILDSQTGSSQRITKLFTQSIESIDRNDQRKTPNFFEAYLRDQLGKHQIGANSELGKIYKGRPEQLRLLEAFLKEVQIERDRVMETHPKKPLAYGPIELAQCFWRMARIKPIGEYLERISAKSGSSAQVDDHFQSLNNTLHHVYQMYGSLDDQRSMTFVDYFLEKHDCEVPAAIGNSVEVSTIHSAKGLEFPVVFVLGMQHRGGSVISSWNKCLAPIQPDAEESIVMAARGAEYGNKNSRLLYVAMTRARNLLYVGTNVDYSELLDTTQAHFADFGCPLPPNRIGDPISKQSHFAPRKTLQSLSMQVSNDANKVVQTNQLPASMAIDMAAEEAVVRPVVVPGHGAPFLKWYCTDTSRPPRTLENFQTGSRLWSQYSQLHSLRAQRPFVPIRSYSCWTKMQTQPGLNRAWCQIKNFVTRLPCR